MKLQELINKIEDLQPVSISHFEDRVYGEAESLRNFLSEDALKLSVTCISMEDSRIKVWVAEDE